jgi:hypothetical protein
MLWLDEFLSRHSIKFVFIVFREFVIPPRGGEGIFHIGIEVQNA